MKYAETEENFENPSERTPSSLKSKPAELRKPSSRAT